MPASFTAVPDVEVLLLADVPGALALDVALRMVARVRAMELPPGWARPMLRGDPVELAAQLLGYAPRTARQLLAVLVERGVVTRTAGTRSVPAGLSFTRAVASRAEVLVVEASTRRAPGDRGTRGPTSTGGAGDDAGTRGPHRGTRVPGMPGGDDCLCDTGHPPSPPTAVGADAPPLSPGASVVGADAPASPVPTSAPLFEMLVGGARTDAAATPEPVSTVGVPAPAAPAASSPAPRAELCPELRRHAERRARSRST